MENVNGVNGVNNYQKETKPVEKKEEKDDCSVFEYEETNQTPDENAIINEMKELYSALSKAESSDLRDQISSEIKAKQYEYKQEKESDKFEEENLEEIQKFQSLIDNSSLPENQKADLMGLIGQAKDPASRDAVMAKIKQLAAATDFEDKDNLIHNIENYITNLNYSNDLSNLYADLSMANNPEVRDQISMEIFKKQLEYQMEYQKEEGNIDDQ